VRRSEQQQIESSGLYRLVEAALSRSKAEADHRNTFSASQEPQPQSPNGRRIVLSEARPVPRRGLSRVEAAMYVGISPPTFGQMVRDGTMPPPKRVGSRKLWDVRELDMAFDALPSENPGTQGTTWDDFRADYDKD